MAAAGAGEWRQPAGQLTAAAAHVSCGWPSAGAAPTHAPDPRQQCTSAGAGKRRSHGESDHTPETCPPPPSPGCYSHAAPLTSSRAISASVPSSWPAMAAPGLSAGSWRGERCGPGWAGAPDHSQQPGMAGCSGFSCKCPSPMQEDTHAGGFPAPQRRRRRGRR